MANTYIANKEKSIRRASKITGVPVDVIKANYKNLAGAPDGKTKQALCYAYKFMKNYAKAGKKAAEAEVAPAVEAE